MTAGDLILVGIVIAAAWAAKAYFARLKQRAEERWALERNWTRGATDPDLAERWRGTFGLPANSRVTRLMVGPAEVQGGRAASFEIGDGYGWRGYRWHVVTRSLPTTLPTLELTREVRRGRHRELLGKHVIAFESAQFNRAWHVESAHAKFAYDVLHQRLLERLLLPDARGLSVRIDGSGIACWRWGPAVVGLVDARLDLLDAFVAAIPRFVWLEYGYDPGADVGSAVDTQGRRHDRRNLSERFADWWAVSVSSGPARRRRGREIKFRGLARKRDRRG